MTEIINKPLLLHLVGYLYYWQMGFNSVFKGLMKIAKRDIFVCVPPSQRCTNVGRQSAIATKYCKGWQL